MGTCPSTSETTMLIRDWLVEAFILNRVVEENINIFVSSYTLQQPEYYTEFRNQNPIKIRFFMAHNISYTY